MFNEDSTTMTRIIYDTCKIGQGSACCKYLVVGSVGFECMKIDAANKKIIDDNWAKNEHVAQGDNCEGKTMTELKL